MAVLHEVLHVPQLVVNSLQEREGHLGAHQDPGVCQRIGLTSVRLRSNSRKSTVPKTYSLERFAVSTRSGCLLV